jgi:hypothetical protein
MEVGLSDILGAVLQLSGNRAISHEGCRRRVRMFTFRLGNQRFSV